MSLTKDEITPGHAYKVSLASAQFGPALEAVKKIDGITTLYAWDAKAGRHIYVQRPEAATAAYNGKAKTWTVTVPRRNDRALEMLQSLIGLGAAIERA